MGFGEASPIAVAILEKLKRDSFRNKRVPDVVAMHTGHRAARP
jgi:hypothetical protein